jgi:hypothetical protein
MDLVRMKNCRNLLNVAAMTSRRRTVNEKLSFKWIFIVCREKDFGNFEFKICEIFEINVTKDILICGFPKFSKYL